MPRFTFSLERVLKHRERRERIAHQQRQQALAVVKGFESQAAELNQKLKDIARAQESGLGQATDLAAWLVAYRQADQVGKQLSAVQARQRDAEKLLQQAADWHKKCAREAEGLRQLRERRRRDFLGEVAKKEQVQLDDVGLRRWLGQSRDASQVKGVDL